MLSRCLVDIVFAYYLCVDQCYQGVLSIWFLLIIYVLINVIKVSCQYGFCLLFMRRSMLSRCLVDIVFAYYLCVDQCYQGVLSIWFLLIIYVLINVIKVSCQYGFCLLFMRRSMLSRCLVDMVFAYYLCVDQCYQGVLSI